MYTVLLDTLYILFWQGSTLVYLIVLKISIDMLTFSKKHKGGPSKKCLDISSIAILLAAFQ